MSHVEIDSKMASLMESSIGKLPVEDTMYLEAQSLHERGLIPRSEIARLSQNPS
jgi:hypothetical protein